MHFCRKNVFFVILLCTKSVYSNILKQSECGLYDAEFSTINSNVRLNETISLVLTDVSLVQCETQCTVHSQCLSVNYMKTNSVCELVDGDQKCGISEHWVDAPGWTHYGTLDKKALGPWCTNNNPCSTTETCEDQCNQTHRCIPQQTNILNSHVVTASQLGDDSTYPAQNVLDGNHDTFHHTRGIGIHYWKVVFDKRIFIHRIRIVHINDCDICPERGIDLKVKVTVTSLGSRVEKICANIGELGPEKTLDCNEYADELEIFRDYTSNLVIHLAEVYFYGKTCYV